MPDWYWKRQNKGMLAGRCIVRLSVSFFIGVFMGQHEIYNENRKRKGRKYDAQIILLDVEVDWR